MDILNLHRRNVELSRTWFEEQDWMRFGVNIGECMEYTFVSLFNKMTMERLRGDSTDTDNIVDAIAAPETGGADRNLAPNPPGLGGATRTDTNVGPGGST